MEGTEALDEEEGSRERNPPATAAVADDNDSKQDILKAKAAIRDRHRTTTETASPPQESEVAATDAATSADTEEAENHPPKDDDQSSQAAAATTTYVEQGLSRVRAAPSSVTTTTTEQVFDRVIQRSKNLRSRRHEEDSAAAAAAPTAGVSSSTAGDVLQDNLIQGSMDSHSHRQPEGQNVSSATTLSSSSAAGIHQAPGAESVCPGHHAEDTPSNDDGSSFSSAHISEESRSLIQAEVVDEDAVRREIISQAVCAEVIEESIARRCNCHTVLFRTAVLCLLVIAVGVSVAFVVGNGNQDNGLQDKGVPSVATTAVPSVAPTLAAATLLVGFNTTEELFQAVKQYPTVTNSSDLALKYGYPIGRWDVSRITNFSLLFAPTTIVWDTEGRSSHVDCTFNEDLSGWDTASARTMSQMFLYCKEYEGAGIETWNTGLVTDMSGMFHGASLFNQDLSTWNTSLVESMNFMFRGASRFDSDVSQWDVSQVKDMSNMFRGASLFNQDLSTWNTSQVKSMSAMFDGASKYDSDMSQWDVSQVQDMANMFFDAKSFNSNMSAWDVGRVIHMAEMFWGAASFNQSLCGWGPKVHPNVNVRQMLENSGCENTSVSLVVEAGENNSVVSWCHVCNTQSN